MALPRMGNARALALAAFPALILFASPAGVRPAAAQITDLAEAPEVIETKEPLPFIMFGILGTGSFNTYRMRELNRSLELMNLEITQPGVKFARFSKGASLGFGLRAIVKGRYVAEATRERVIADEKIGGTTAKNEIVASSNAYLFTLGWDMMKSRGAAFGPAVGVGYYDSIAEQILTETPVGQDPMTVGKLELTGNALGMHAGAYFEAALAGRMWVNAFLGYRSAKVTDLKITGFRELSQAFAPGSQRLPQTRAIAPPVATCATCTDTDGDSYPDDVPQDAVLTLQGGGDSLDYSGFMGKLALTWYFNAPVD